MVKIILASGSPSRKKLFTKLNLPFSVIPSNFDEEKIKKIVKNGKELVTRLSLKKAKIVAQRLKNKGIKNFLVIGVDSAAAIKKPQRANRDKWIFFDKPKDKRDARKMLLFLKGKAHKFYTAVVVINNKGEEKKALFISTVYFKNFSNDTLKKVLDRKIWQGRAGGYDIKKNMGELIEKFEGREEDFYLPLRKLTSILKEFGVKMK